MKVSKEQVSENRRLVLEAAARLFRERGFDGVTVADVMRAAGLTHGAFYGHFSSKEDLIAQAFAHVLAGSAATSPLPRYADAYLSPVHRDNHGGGCLFAALGSEAARGPDNLRHELTESVRRQIEHFTATAPGRTKDARRGAAIASWSAMVGALMLSRIVDDPALSDEILAGTRASLDA